MTDYLPIELARIKEISQRCKASSSGVVEKFVEVMKTMDEMCEATLVKQGKVKVHYVGYNAGHDQWVPTIRVRRDIFKERAEEDEEDEVTMLFDGSYPAWILKE